jgi:MoaA/NifB/PqqE/SkfB family radical SAM enzyme
VEVVEGQGIERAEAELRALGVCGRCGRDRAAIGMDGQLTPCVLGRFLIAGNVKETPLGDILDGEAWRKVVASVPVVDACVTCTPADSNDCNPSRKL